MPYQVGFSLKDAITVSVAYCLNAGEAIKTVRALKATTEELRFIRSPTGLVVPFEELEAMATLEQRRLAEKPAEAV